MYGILWINPKGTGSMRFSDRYQSTRELTTRKFSYLIIHFFNTNRRKKGLRFN
jgi:hypothetical protein